MICHGKNPKKKNPQPERDDSSLGHRESKVVGDSDKQNQLNLNPFECSRFARGLRDPNPLGNFANTAKKEGRLR